MFNKKSIEMQSSILTMRIIEHRLIREFKRVALMKVAEIFNSYCKKMDSETLKMAEINELTSEPMNEILEEFKDQGNFFDETDVDKLFIKLLSHANHEQELKPSPITFEWLSKAMKEPIYE
jgi:hypothetical protein